MTDVYSHPRRYSGFVLGETFDRYVPVRPNGAKWGRHDKLARRLLRRRLMVATRSRVDIALVNLRRAMLAVTRLASNSHEARRYLVVDKKERDNAAIEYAKKAAGL